MNYRGSARHLLRNSKAAMLAAIEIYNKPQVAYRDETFVILLLNAWELGLKALLSRRGQTIYYPKRRNQPYRTFALADALAKAETSFPPALSRVAIRRNVELLSTYRDNATHFYNEVGFGVLIYSLAQQSILNYVSLLREAFGDAFSQSVTWDLLPLGLRAPIDPVEYIEGIADQKGKASAAVRSFITETARAAQDVSDAGGDASQLMTAFKVTLVSVKKLAKADAVVGVAGTGAAGGVSPIAIVRRADPNETHPLSRSQVIEQIDDLHPRHSSVFVLQALSWKHGLMADERFCWTTANGAVRQYSPNLVSFVKKLSRADVDAAIKDYKAR